MGTLIAEDLLLLLLDDELGSMTTSYADAVLGGALLVELALAGAVTVPEKTSVWRTAKVRPSGEPVGEPALREALATVAHKERSAQDLVGRLGEGQRDRLADGLVERGILERREDRVLGLFARKRWLAIDSSREEELRRALTVVLVQGADPDERTGALVALLSAVDPGAPGGRPLRQLLPRGPQAGQAGGRERLTRPDGRVRISRGRPGRCRG
jgi:hypothetical protein